MESYFVRTKLMVPSKQYNGGTKWRLYFRLGKCPLLFHRVYVFQVSLFIAFEIEMQDVHFFVFTCPSCLHIGNILRRKKISFDKDCRLAMFMLNRKTTITRSKVKLLEGNETLYNESLVF